MTISDYKNVLKKRLSEDRYHHSICVSKQAVVLAELTGANKDKARLAGLLHDICKEMSPASQLQYLKSHDIILSNPILDNPFVWHGITGSVYLEKKFGIADREILDAVYYHTTGRAEMSLIEEIVFLSDYTSDDRSYTDRDKIRKLLEVNWNKAILEGLKFGIKQGCKNETELIIDTVEAYNYYLNKNNRKQGPIMTPQEIVNVAVKTLDKGKATDIVVLDVGNLTSLGDHFIIASGNSTIQVKALAGEVEKVLKEKGITPIHTEQKERGSHWTLIDYGAVMIHIFHKDTRAFYELERLWSDAHKQNIEEIING